jgi:hypothetical protein
LIPQLRAYLAALVDFTVGDLVDFMVGVLVASLDPLASLGLLVYLVDLGDFKSLAMTLAQMIAKMRKRVLRANILLVCLFDLLLE